MNRSAVLGASAITVSAALAVGLSIVWPGLDARETPVRDSSTWVLQADGLRYGRVNTLIGELDTVRSVSNPSRLVDTGRRAFLFTDSDSRLVSIDESAPADVDAAALAGATRAPAGTVEVDVAGDFIVYRTEAGEVWGGRAAAGAVSALEIPGPADAMCVNPAGHVLVFSAATAQITAVDLVTGAVVGSDGVQAELDSPILACAGENWALVEPASGRFLGRGRAEIGQIPTVGTVVAQRASTETAAVSLADEAGLLVIPVDDGAAERTVGDTLVSRGTPARPVWRDGVLFAAWLPEGAGPGVAFATGAGEVPLDYGGQTLPAQRRPVLTGGADALVLNDARSGWVWQLPGGALVPSSQAWDAGEEQPAATAAGDPNLPALLDPKPPVAVDDAFGVRAGALVPLPVLLNDYDPNDDVLAIDAGSVSPIDPAFGTISVTDDRQRLAVRVHPDAVGSVSLSYEITDGTSTDGLRSPPATVTLTVVPESQQTPPQWCAVAECRQQWPGPQTARGGTVSVPVLSGWVDPEGDPLFLLSVVDLSGSGTVAMTPTGEVVYQHNGGGEPQAPLSVTVADTRGGQSTRSLVVTIRDQPDPVLASFAVVAAAGARVEIDVAEHVVGAADVAVTAARVLDDAEATASLTDGTSLFDFSAPAPGDYRVAVTVSAQGREATGVARITLVDPERPATLATAPVVAFVRPQADATVDVFSAVSNPTSRVLLLSDAVVRAAPGAQLAADVLAQSQLRVSGTTASGAAGVLGTVSYRVSDGTADQGAAVTGEATVYLLPAASETPPIARDDRITVRAGDQIDIAVLQNDVSSSGARPRLDPASIVSSSPDALAFAAGDTLRYLAPDAPGEQTIDYRAYTVGAPTLTDDARVRVSVVAADQNRAPTPPELSGRVLSGLSTSIPVSGFGMDPDGDVVRLTEISAQPAKGSAAVSADGSAIVYTSVPGDAGQVTFRYRVADASGAVGEAQVRVGILDSDTDPRPIAYTDYVHVQAGAQIRVQPLANDVDPTQGELSLTRVRPDQVEVDETGATTEAFTQAQERIVAVAGDTVTFAAGAAPDVQTFRYDVRSSSGNTARGLIVVRTLAQAVPDYPVVTDTVLTAADRDRLSTGVDVLTGKVLWSGDGPLTLGLWGTPSGLSAEGTMLRGQLDEGAHVIAFSVSGRSGGSPVTSYAFLRVPASADLAPALRVGAPLTVPEGGQAEFDIADQVVVERGGVLQVGPEVRAGGARPQASCVWVDATTVRYTAGAGAPWQDSCVVPVRVAGAPAWNVLAIPIVVTPIDPQPSLRNASLELEPGHSDELDLAALTTWRGMPEPIGFRLVAAPRAVDVTLDGSTLRLRARDDAAPGTVEVVEVVVSSHQGVPPARVTIRIGAPPSTYPAGGTVSQECSQAAGSACTFEVIGAPGQVNPFPSTPLSVSGVRADCAGLRFSVASATAVTVSWGEDRPGGTCVAAFTVRDAQGRESAGGRDGRIDFALLGYPAGPAALVQQAYGDGSLTLHVDAGAAANSSPAVTGFEIHSAGTVVAHCTAQGACPAISAPNGQQRLYQAFAVNAVGLSRTAAEVTAWAYRPPAAPTSVTAAPVVAGDAGGIARIQVSGLDGETGQVRISSPVGQTVTVPVPAGRTSVLVDDFAVGANTATTVTVTPLSRFETPPGMSALAPESATVLAHGIGAPGAATLTLTATARGDGTVDVLAVGDATAGGDDSELRFGIVPAGRSCAAGQSSPRAHFGPLPDGELYTYDLCVESVRGGVSFGRVTASAQIRAVQSGAAPVGYTFVVGPDAHLDDDRASWTIDRSPTSTQRVPNQNQAVFEGLPSTIFDVDPGIRVRYEHLAGWWQSAWGQVTPAAGSAPTQLQARWSVGVCQGGSRLDLTGTSTGDQARIRFDLSGIRYEDAEGRVLASAGEADAVPDAAVRVRGIVVRVDWSAQGWRLDPVAAELSAACTPVPQSDPEPDGEDE